MVCDQKLQQIRLPTSPPKFRGLNVEVKLRLKNARFVSEGLPWTDWEVSQSFNNFLHTERQYQYPTRLSLSRTCTHIVRTIHSTVTISPQQYSGSHL